MSAVVTKVQAFKDYAGLGDKRSLKKLHQQYASTGKSFPSLDTLKNWSRKYSWQQKIKIANENALKEAAFLQEQELIKFTLCAEQQVLFQAIDMLTTFKRITASPARMEKMSPMRLLCLMEQGLATVHNLHFAQLERTVEGRAYVFS